MSRAGFQPRREPKTSDLLIRQKVEAMIEYGHCALRQFPKSERHVLSAEIRGSMWALLRLVIVCNKRHHKKTTLQELDAELDLLRAQVRLARPRARFPRLSHMADSSAATPSEHPPDCPLSQASATTLRRWRH